MNGHWVVRLPTWLGDTVMSVPTIRALARCSDRLTLWGADNHLQLLRFTGVTGKHLSFARRPGIAATADLVRAARDLERLRPDGVVLLPNAFEPALTARIAGVRRRVGYATDARRWLLTDAVPTPAPWETLHDGDRFARLLAPLRVPPPHPEDTRLEVPRGTELAARLLGSAPRPLGLVPGCVNGPSKRWPARFFARLGEQANRRWGATPVILGGLQDVDVARQLESACSTACVNLTGRTDVLELAAVLRACHAVVSNDTGAAHLAASLSSPTLQLFGPTDPARTRARGPRVRIASIGAFCQPCMSKLCPLDHRCMEAMPPELVLGVLEPLWEGSATASVS